MRSIYLALGLLLAACTDPSVAITPEPLGEVEAPLPLSSPGAFYPVPVPTSGWIQVAEVKRLYGRDQQIEPDVFADYFVQVELDPSYYVEGEFLTLRLTGGGMGIFVLGGLFRTIPGEEVVENLPGIWSSVYYQFRFINGRMEQVAPRAILAP